MQLILGSQSPRRREILSYFSVPFEVKVPQFDEDSIEFTGNPSEYVTLIAQGKASALAASFPDRPILTADTTVYRQGRIFNKPQNEKEAIDMLQILSGQWHSVFTAVTLKFGTKYTSRVEETRVLFNPLTRQQIELYHQQLHLYDKAGSYQMQMAGGIIVNKIDGCYYNVVGFPLNSVRVLLHEIGIDLWNCLKKLAIVHLFMAASLSSYSFAAPEGTPPHIYYLIHTNHLDTALSHYKGYVDCYGRHDTEFLHQLGMSVLHQGAKSHDPEIELMTLFGAGIALNEMTLDILMRGVECSSPPLQLIALSYLAKYQDDLADSYLLTALRSNSLLIRLEAARQIALKKLPRATFLIESLMGKVDSELLALFPQLFASIGDNDAIKILRRLLSHPREDVLIEAVLSAAKAGRDDMLGKIKILATHSSCALQEACAFAFGSLGDESAVPYLERLSQSSAPQVRLAALQALYQLDRREAVEGIRAMAASGNLFAMTALGEIPGSQNLLYQLSLNENPQIRLNATLGLLNLHDERCKTLLKGILIRDQRDLAFVKMSSQGKSQFYWKMQPSMRQNFEDFSLDLEVSQNFREEVLEQSLELPNDIFYSVAETIFECQQNDLVPLTIELLEMQHTPEAVGLLKKYQQRAGAPLIRSYCGLGLYRLGEEGPYGELLCRWVEQQTDAPLIQLRPLVPWEADGDLTNYEITPHETSRLLVEAFEALAKRQDDQGINALLNAVLCSNSKNKYALAGLLMRAAL